jgi:hypothetical protein
LLLATRWHGIASAIGFAAQAAATARGEGKELIQRATST